MLGWSIAFFVLAIVAAVFGFGGIAGTLAWAAELMFVAFMILFVLSLVANMFAGRKTNPPI